MPLYARIWLMFLIAINMFLPLFFLDRVEAWAVLTALLASMILMTILTAYAGFTRLLGLGHIFWFPLLYFLWSRLDQIPADEFFAFASNPKYKGCWGDDEFVKDYFKRNPHLRSNK